MSTFDVPSKYLGINAIEVKHTDVTALIRKPLNFIQSPLPCFCIGDLTHRDKWTPYVLIINHQRHVVLFNPRFAEDKQAVDYLVALLHTSISLTIITESAMTAPRLKLELSPGLMTNTKRQPPKLMETSSFCDLVNDALRYDPCRFKSVVALLMSFCHKLQTYVENAVIAKFPHLKT